MARYTSGGLPYVAHMQIIQHKPAARGVSQLMYVGDVEVSAVPLGVKIGIAIALGWLLLRKRR